ncbi:LysM peptidoglycan-binding domain-containing protein [Actinomadura macrotermitis]|uniref:LysM domain-containing protein n=1 Tax=Actinomadura macrotermitis TaxID=2585200 RepID=A0A7K0C7A6_9ACTN|nr:LysM peptidoglycan-binding domain-containing protein [Actinomadura macrotermitis]MQY09298.1 hypothetical protein [Actinomadura macrotermitis]
MELAATETIIAVGQQNDAATSELDVELARFFTGTTVRFYAAVGGGFGHQAGTVLLLKKFVGRGLLQDVELVYGDPEILAKLRTLLPQIEEGETPPPFVLQVGDRAANVALVSRQEVQRLPVVKFAISGGCDHTPDALKRLAVELRTELMMVLQPYGWEKEGGSQGQSSVYFPAASEPRYVDLGSVVRHIDARLYRWPSIEISDTEWGLLEQLAGQRERIRAARALLDAVRADRLFCPIYGISDLSHRKAGGTPPPSTILFNTAATIRRLQEQDSRYRKGAVILCLSEIGSWRMSKGWLDGSIPLDGAAGRFFQEYIKPGGVPKVFVREDLADADEIKAAIDALQPDQVLILNLHSLPQGVFNLLYGKASFPCMFEGAGTAGLVIPFGTPYFRFTYNYPELPFGALQTVEGMAAQGITREILLRPGAWSDGNAIPPNLLAEYITLAYTEDSPLERYYRQFREFLNACPEEEKLQAALQWVFTSRQYRESKFSAGARPLRESALERVYRDLTANLDAQGNLALAPGAFSSGPLAKLYESMSGQGRMVLAEAEVRPPGEGKVEARGRAAGVLGLAQADVALVFTEGDSGLVGTIRVEPGGDAGVWSLTGAPWFPLKEPFLRVVQPADPAAVVSGSVGASIPLPGAADGASAAHVTLSVPPVAGRWVFEAAFTAPGPGLARLFGLLGGVNLAAALPAPLNAAADLAVRRFQIAYGVTSREVESFSVRFGTTEPWPLVGNVVLADLEITANVAEPGRPARRRTGLEVTGAFQLGPGAVRVSARLPEQVFLGTLVPPADAGEHVRIGDVVALFLPAGRSVPVDGAVTLFDFQYNRPAGVWSVACGVQADWPVPPAPARPWFTIENLEFAARGDASGIEGRFGGTVLVLPDSAKITLAVEASYAKDTGWCFEGRQTGGAVPLGDLLAAYTGWKTDVKYGIANLELRIATGTGSWVFGGGTAEPWSLPFLPGSPLLTGRLRLGYNAPAPAGPGPAVPAPGYFARLETEVAWEGVRLGVWWDYNPEVNAFGITWNGLQGKITGPAKDTGDYTAELGLAADATLGSVIEAMVSWVTGQRFALAAPWSFLNAVRPGDLALTYRFNPADRSHNQIGFKIGIGPIDVGFARIDGIGVTYQSTGPDRGVLVTLNGFFPWNVGADAVGDTGSLGPWDASKPGTAPAPPGRGGKYLDLRLLALGQHIDVPGLAQDDTVMKAVRRLSELPAPVAGDIPDVRLDRAVSWTAGLDLGILRVEGGEKAPDARDARDGAEPLPAYLLNGQVVFCDPRLYGLRLALDGPAAKVFKGLALEVMYRQISDTVGVYQAEIALPERMRRLSIGAYTLTLPLFAIAVYTNGDFLVDVGFPRNMDFSRSFTIEAIVYPGIPLLGAGGFYLGKLSSATTDLVPKAVNGTFNPVIVFGLGLRAGFGKSVEYGPLRAGFDLTIAGVLEGVVGKWNPYRPDAGGAVARAGASDQVQGSYYFLVRGTVGLLGRLYGSVDFAVVKADVDVRISALAEIVYESFAALSLSLVLSVDASAGIRIDLGLFTVKISFRFSLRLKQTFTIDNPGTPPWRTAGAPRPGVLGGPAGRRLRMRRELAAAGRRTARPPAWGNLLPPAEPARLTGYAVPGLTLARDEWAAAGRAEQPPCWVAMLLVESVPPVDEAMAAGPADGSAGDTSFEALCKGVLRWVVAAVQDGPRTAGQIDDLVVDELDLAHLLDEVLVSGDAAPAPIPADAVERFLTGSFRLTARVPGSGAPEAGEAAEQNAAYLPVPPSLVLDVPAYGSRPGTRYAFGSYNTVDGRALARLRSYFAELAVQVSEEPPARPGAVSESSLSMAGWVFSDYFLLLARQMVQAVRDGLRLFKYPVDPEATPLDAVRWINENREAPGSEPVPAYTVADLFTANASHPLQPAQALTIGVTCRAGEDDTCTTLAQRHQDAVSGAEIAAANAAAPGLLRPGAVVALPGGRAHTVRAGDTLIGVAAALGTRYTELVTGSGLLDQTGLLFPGAEFLVPLVTCEAGAGATFAEVAGCAAYAGAFTAADLARRNGGRAVLRPGALVPFPNREPYQVRPGDVLGDVAANLGVSLDELIAEGGVLTAPDLIAPMASLAVPVFGHVTAAGDAFDTLGSVAARFGVTAATLGEQPANGEAAGLFADRDAAGTPAPYLDVPHLTRFRLGELIAEAQRTFAIRQLSALASRYCLHGMRLPTEGVEPRARGMWVRGEDGALRLPPLAGLHALTGQQLPLPPLSGEPFRVFLDRAGGPGWLRFADASGAGTDRLEFTLTPGTEDARRVAGLREQYGQGERLDIGLESLGADRMDESAPATYPCSRPVPWRSPVPVPLPYGPAAPDAGGLRLYRLPGDLTGLADRSVRACDPRMRVRAGRYDESTGGTGTSDAGAHAWATAVTVRVKRVPQVEGSPATASTYEITGVGDRDAVLLERLLQRWGGEPDAAAIDRLVLAFPGADDDPGLANDTLPQVTMGIAQVDLSTRTRPPATPVRAAAEDTGPRLLNDPREFVRLLWEAGITRGGGFYLYYFAAAEGRGLPERLFAGGDEAAVTLLVLYAAPAASPDRDRVGSFMNRLVTSAGIPDDATVFAEADPPEPPVRVPATAGLRLGDLARSYYGDVADLVAANTAVPLAAGARIVVDAGVYQAPPGGIALADAARRFGTTVEALRAANPGWDGGLPDPLRFPDAIRLPRLELTPGQSPFSGTFGQVIAGYGQGAASLAAANRDVPGPFQPGREIVVPGGPRVRTATVPPGVAAVAAARKEPHEVPAGTGGADSARLFLLNAFTMLGYRIAGNAAFTGSRIGLPAGPATEPADPANHDKIRAPRAPAPGEGVWDYRQSLPYSRFVKRAQGDPASPYAGVGEILQVSFGWNDVYGNTVTTVLTDPENGDQGPFDQPPLLTGYTDALVGLGRWASVSSSWQVRADDAGRPRLDLLLDFDDSPYQGLLEAAAPGATTVDLTFTAPLGPDGIGDTAHYVFDEDVTVASATLGGDGRTVRLTVSALAAGHTYHLAVHGLGYAGQGGAIEGRAGFAFPADAQARTSTVAARAAADAAVYTRLREQLNDPNGIAFAVRTTLLEGTGDTELSAEQVRALRAWLCDGDTSILAFLAARAAFASAAPAPAAGHPIGIMLPPGSVNQAEIFPLRAAFRLARTGGTVLGDLATVPGVRETLTPVAPYRHPVPAAESADGSLALTEFARRLQAALSDDRRLVQVAVGVDRFAAEAASEEDAPAVWAVRVGRAPGTPISYAVSGGGPAVFAPRPLSTHLLSRRGVPIRGYATGRGLDPVPTRHEDFAEADVDGWCRTLFGAVDTLLTPRFTAAMQVVGALAGADFLGRALRVKERLAADAARWMIPAFDGEHADPAHVRELFRQQLLTGLLGAYSVRAAVQFTADVHAGVPGDAEPPELYGQPVQRRPETADDDSAAPVSLTSPRLPLRTGAGVPLGFLVTAPDTVRADGAVVPRVDLDVRYEADAIEHQIGPVAGIAGHRASSWLTFVDRDPAWPLSADLGAFAVPLALRAYPESPTMAGQRAHRPDDGGPLDRALRWGYRFTYTLPFHYPQDRVVATVAFNVGDQGPLQDADGAFGPLAEFATVHPAVARDLEDFLAPVDAAAEPGQGVTNAAAALRAFLTLAEAAADAGLAPAAGRPAVAGGTTCAFTIDEGSVDAGATPRALLVTVTGTPPAGAGGPEVEIEGYQAVEHGTVEPGRRAYLYRRPGAPEGEYLTAAAGQAVPGRTLLLTGLRLLEQQDALASVAVERNRELVPGRPSAEPFVYRTPAIRAAAPLQPSAAVDEVLPVELIGVAAPAKPAHRTLAAHLEAVFAALLEHTADPALTVQMEATYLYRVNPDLAPVTLPLLMQAPLTVRRSDGSLTRMTTGWAQAIEAWFRDRSPVCGGVLGFDLTLMTHLTARPMPLLRLRNLRLPVEYVIDPPLPCRPPTD